MVVREVGRGRIESINIPPGGVPKKYVFVVNVLIDRIEGDDQKNKLHHGGRLPDRSKSVTK